MPKIEFKSSAKPSTYAYPPPLEDKKEKSKEKVSYALFTMGECDSDFRFDCMGSQHFFTTIQSERLLQKTQKITAFQFYLCNTLLTRKLGIMLCFMQYYSGCITVVVEGLMTLEPNRSDLKLYLIL